MSKEELVEIEYQYGSMSSLYSVKATNKLTAYAAMVIHYGRNAHMIALFEPEQSKEDQWLNIMGQISERLDEVFGGKDSFDKYIESHIEDIKACIKTRKQLC